MVQDAGIPQLNTKVISTICMTDIFTALIKGTWMNMHCRKVDRIRRLVLRLMRAARTIVSTLMVLDADMKRFRTAATPTI
jgi:hypothetical protein